MKNYLFLLAVIAISCTASPTNSSDSDQNQSNPEELTSTGSEVDFPTFLAAFTKALKDVDNQTLNGLVAEKLAVWGREDQDPKLELDYIDRIIKVVEVYELGGIVDSETLKSVSYQELFANEELLKKNIQGNADEQRIEDFVFSKDKTGQWKLTLVFWNTKKK